MNTALLNLLAALAGKLHSSVPSDRAPHLRDTAMSEKESHLLHLLELNSELAYDEHKRTYWLTVVGV